MSKKTSRRDFLQWTAISLGSFGTPLKSFAKSGTGISIVSDPGDPIASAAPAAWAAQALGEALAQQGVTVRHLASIEKAPAGDLCIVASGAKTPLAAAILKRAKLEAPAAAESLALVPSVEKGRKVLLACGADARGLMYALLELADRAGYAENPLETLRMAKPLAEQPFNQARSIGRSFTSDVQDKPWYNDRDFWPAYFAMLAAQRVNRFSLNFGIGFDTLVEVLDSYFLFVYPFLLAVPGYDVRAVGLPDAERDHNLEMLQYISQQAVAHGIDFVLGIWTHGYQWRDTPHTNYTISGLTPENHADYSQAALAAVLKACPAISSVTLRTHGESGVREGSYGFWRKVFDGVPKSGRRLEIDLHTKGLNQELIGEALATGMPVKLSPKYWAEHMGLPYQQAAIRELEMPDGGVHGRNYYSLSEGTRIFTRYGYADFLREDRPYTVMFRIWPGTHRFLLWGDAQSNAAHARAFRFCGCNGVELYEPLTFKGRRGSGLPGGRCAYEDASLKPERDWEKYEYTYRTWGRMLYNPEADADVWRRQLRKEFPANAVEVESALRAATSIVPIITTAHMPSAANDTYGPEFYTSQSILDVTAYSPYGDTPAPKVFGNVSPIDPQMFSRMNDFAAELLKGERGGKYSPIEVAAWLEDAAEKTSEQLTAAEKKDKNTAEFRRLALDLKIEIGLARFFAAKFRSGVLYGIYEQSGDRAALEESLKAYRQAREVWAAFAQEAKGEYMADITYGPRPYERGHWLDRLPAMDEDIAKMASKLESAQGGGESSAQARAAIQEALGRPKRTVLPCAHTPAKSFDPGKDLEIALSVAQLEGVASVRMYYRHVNQAEHYESAEMQNRGGEFRATIPALYTATKYPLQYYFELRRGPADAWLYPGFNAERTNQPYFVVRSV